MRRLTDSDLAGLAGTTVQGYLIEKARTKRGAFTDSDHYGIMLGENAAGNHVTWQFHLDENDAPYVYWGHYFMEDRDAAALDFESRDLKGASDESVPRLFRVTITETLKLTVDAYAMDRHEAEQAVSDRWYDSEYILDSDDFVGVEFEAVPADGDGGL